MGQVIHVITDPLAWIGLIAAAAALSAIAYRRRLRWRPALLLRLFLISLIIAGALFSQQDSAQATRPVPAVMIIDQSDSLSEEVRRAVWQQGITWQADADNRMLVVFGVNSEPALSAIGRTDGVSLSDVDGRASDLQSALSVARQLLGSTPGRIILASDGLATNPGEVERTLESFIASGYKLDVLPLNSRSSANDLAVGTLIHPERLWAGSVFDLWIPVYGAAAGEEIQFTLTANGEAAEIRPEAMANGLYRYRMSAESEGMLTVQVMVGRGSETPDPLPENNTIFTVLRVLPPPRVLLISANPGSGPALNFASKIERTGVHLDIRSPEALPTNLEELRSYQVIFLHNLLASQLSREQMVGLQVYVARQAGGLIFLGGRSSYTSGGYSGTLLEPMLPVKLEPPPRSQRPPIVFQLVLDRSASMEMTMNTDTPPIALAREAAMRLIETLQQEDYLGVVSFSDGPVWERPIGQIGSNVGLRQALDIVSQIRADGGTHMYVALQAALLGMMELAAEAPPNRHLLLLSDGQSVDGTPEDFHLLAETARAQGITISTIALGGEADTQLMEEIAEAGKGRFYYVQDADDLPRILISESEAARSENVQTGESRLKPVESSHPVLTGIPFDQLPVLNGYNALSGKSSEGAEDILVSANFNDPILSIWQYGLGKVAAWTTDLGEEWMGAWPDEIQGLFWLQLVRYTLVDPATGPAQVKVSVEPDRVRIDAAVYTVEGEPRNLAEITFSYSDEEGDISSYTLNQVAPGLYRAEIERPADGAYRAALALTSIDGSPAEVPIPFAVNPPDEWLPVDSASGRANLESWTLASGGEVLQSLENTANFNQDNEVLNSQNNNWLRILLLIVVLYWPAEIAIRRFKLPWM